MVNGFATRCGKAVAEMDIEFLRAWLLDRFGIEVKPQRIREWIKQEFPGLIFERWHDHSWRSYFKRRVQDANLLPVGNADPEIFHFGCEMHVGFVGLLETEEELAILRREDKTRVKDGPDTPGIARTIYQPEPIDRVAARVVK